MLKARDVYTAFFVHRSTYTYYWFSTGNQYKNKPLLELHTGDLTPRTLRTYNTIIIILTRSDIDIMHVIALIHYTAAAVVAPVREITTVLLYSNII